MENCQFCNQNRKNEEGSTTGSNSVVENVQPQHTQLEQSETYYEILDTSNWEEWKLKYVNLSVAKGEYDLMVTDLGDNIFSFPLFIFVCFNAAPNFNCTFSVCSGSSI